MNINEILESISFLIPYLEFGWEVIKKWFWVPLPFILWKPAIFYWLWWRQEIWNAQQENIFLEIRPPKENLKPMRAMEAVFTGLWQIYAEPTQIEKWWDGQELLNYSFEVAGIDGVPHFFIRCDKSTRTIVEAHVYSQLPEAEIFEVEDYTKKIPQDIPNKEWDLWACDYRLVKPDPYPIKTYVDFETERESKEEKRIDPISSLIEGISKTKKGEHMWVQIKAKPVLVESSWRKKGKEIINQLTYRGSPEKKKNFFVEMFETMLLGASPKEEKPKEMLPPEMKLTPGEREVVSRIERKISKHGFEVFIRHIYLGKKPRFFKPNLRIPISYFTNFASDSTNGIFPIGETTSKVRKKWYDAFFFPKRRLYLLKRKSFRRYVERLNFDYPLPGPTFVLNTEELATIYHFPSKIQTSASLMDRVEAKKGESPVNLPTEENEEE